MIEALQNLRMKDVPGENVGTVFSYLKGALFLLQNFSAIPTNVMGLLNDVMVLVDYDEFTAYTRSIYFAFKRESLTGVGYMEYLDTVEANCRTLYRKGKWSKKDSTPDSAFVVGSNVGGGSDGR